MSVWRNQSAPLAGKLLLQAYRVMVLPNARAMHTNLTFSLRYANPENLSLQLKVPLVEQEFRPVNAKWSLDLGSVADPIPISPFWLQSPHGGWPFCYCAAVEFIQCS